MNTVNDQENIDPRGTKTPDDEKRLYIWLDILGFSEEVNSKVDSGGANSAILPDLLEKFQRIFLEELKKKHDINGIMISDGIVLDLGVFTRQYHENNLRKIFKEIGQRQLSFMQKEKRLIRGGIALGQTLQANDKNYYISSGLTRAYAIESKCTHWPIIATTEQQIREMKKVLKTRKKITKNLGLQETFNKNSEKIFFIDFLNEEFDSCEYESFLCSILNERLKSKKIYDKHIWLLRHYRERIGVKIKHTFINGAIL